jgi:cell filamentation protein
MLEIRNGTAPEATRSGAFDLEHLKAIHQHTFQDIYEWAGTTRAQPMSIEGEQVRAAPLIHKDDKRPPVPFVPSPRVDRSLNATFAQLREQSYLQELPRAEFADRAAVLFNQINQAHPFMEGNGRTQREFMIQLAGQAGHTLNFDVVSSERMSIVSLEARMGDLSSMKRLFGEITDPGRVAALEKAQTFLEQENKNWQLMYISTATPGRHYDGQIAITSPEVVVMKAEGDVIVAQASDLDGQTEGRVSFTATAYAPPSQDSEGQQRTRQIDFDM